MIAIATSAQACNTDAKQGAIVDTSSTKANHLRGDISTYPSGPQWDAAKKLIAKSDCSACHAPLVMLVAPSYIMIAKQYTATDTTIDKLAKRIIKGSYDVWPGYSAMNPHPKLSKKEAQIMVRYILAFNKPLIRDTTNTK